MTINELLDAARRRLRRLDPHEALDAMADGVVLIDIRSEGQRERNGVIPGAHPVARNALEWRLDPASGHSDPSLGEDLDRHIILVCDEGCQSSLAASTLQDLGFRHATDLSGGLKHGERQDSPSCRTAGTPDLVASAWTTSSSLGSAAPTG